MTEDRALDKERVRFLRAMDEVAPQVWKEVEAAGDSVDLKGWARRHHLPPWAAEYASERLRFDDWIGLIRGQIPILEQSTRSPPFYDPRRTHA
jgi:hypothetical protein